MKRECFSCGKVSTWKGISARCPDCRDVTDLADPLADPLANTPHADLPNGSAERLKEIDTRLQDINLAYTRLSTWDKRQLENAIQQQQNIMNAAAAKKSELLEILHNGDGKKELLETERVALLEEKRNLQLHEKLKQLQELSADIRKLQEDM